MTEDEAIKAAHPTRSGRHDLYAEAGRLVGARHEKAKLVELVTWLLVERDDARATARRLAVGKYMRWSDAGGPADCPHGYARGIPCRTCDVDKTIHWCP